MILPPLLLALKLPPTVDVPMSSAPVLFNVRLPLVVTVPSVKALASVSDTFAPLALTAPLKSLPAEVSEISPPAVKSVGPVLTVSVPAVCVMLPVVASRRRLAT